MTVQNLTFDIKTILVYNVNVRLIHCYNSYTVRVLIGLVWNNFNVNLVLSKCLRDSASYVFYSVRGLMYGSVHSLFVKLLVLLIC